MIKIVIVWFYYTIRSVVKFFWNYFGTIFQSSTILCLVKDKWWGHNTRNERMDHMINCEDLLHHPFWLQLNWHGWASFFNDFVWLRITDRVQCPKCAYGPYYKWNPIWNGVYILVEVSFCIGDVVIIFRRSSNFSIASDVQRPHLMIPRLLTYFCILRHSFSVPAVRFVKLLSQIVAVLRKSAVVQSRCAICIREMRKITKRFAMLLFYTSAWTLSLTFWPRIFMSRDFTPTTFIFKPKRKNFKDKYFAFGIVHTPWIYSFDIQYCRLTFQ